MYQTTLKFPVEISGIGLHSGIENKIRLLPAPVNSGIWFKYKGVSIKANYKNSCHAILCSAISDGNIRLLTVEHLLATLFALQIDNVTIELASEEIPILDGSALPFASKILESGIRFFNAPRQRLIIKRERIYRLNDAYAIARPSDKLIIKYTIDFPSKIIGKQSFAIEINPKSFIEEIAPARTFCEFKDIQDMRNLGLIKGGSLENAIVVDDMRILNDRPLRYINEFVRHKILDAIGDISLIGYDISGEFEFYKSGHNLNQHLVKDILLSPLNYEIIETDLIEDKERIRLFSALPELISGYK